MALNLQAAKINAAVSSEGRWVMLSEGGEVLVARWDNPAFRSLQTKLQQEYRRPAPGRKHIKGRTVPPEIAEEMNYRLVLDTILLDWRDIEESPGAAFPYSKGNAKDLLGKEEYRWIFDEIVNAALDESSYRAEELEEDIENLPRSLPGNSNMVRTLTG
mgnify:CR=1 FL=1